MDLFYGNTFEDHLRALKKDIKSWAKTKYGYDYKQRKLFIAFGKKEHVGNNILLVTPPPARDSKPFGDRNCIFLKSLLTQYEITNFFLTPSFIVPKDIISKADIKEYSKFIDIIVDILQAKLIVVLGEESVFSFFKKKFILRDYHGTIIGSTRHGADVVLTYAPDYYNERSEYEDPGFKRFLQKNDWTFISKLYKERVK